MITTGFSGIFSIDKWTLTPNGGIIDTTKTPSELILYNADNNNGRQDTTAIITSPLSGNVSFDWIVTNVNSSYELAWDPFIFHINNTKIKLTSDDAHSGSGSFNYSINVGDSFGFNAETGDSTDGYFENKIYNFRFVGIQHQPIITNFSIPPKIFGEPPFSIAQPISNSLGSFTYTSSNISVATINGSVVTIVGPGISTISALQSSNGNYSSSFVTTTLTVQPPLPSSNICFRKGTPIRTDQGLIHIDKINTDIHTIRNKNIVAITKTVTQDNYLVCFEKDSLGHNMPSQKTVISANHKIFNKGRMIKAKEFIGKYENIYKVKYSGEVLYNVLMEEYDKIVVNNLICESLHPENAIAKLYKFLEGFNLEQQEEIIKKFNEITIEKHISSSISSKR
jgi:hypothetical protein